MYNWIGAYIITFFLLALAFKKPSLSKYEDEMAALPVWNHVIILVLLVGMFIDIALENLDSFFLISIPNMLLSGFTYWVHEAGHIYWMWGGDLLHSFGGTLNEIIFPLVPAYFCLKKKCFFLGSILLFWFGHNCFGISRYISDARAQVLPLPHNATHDWYTILGKLGLLKEDTVFGEIVYTFGVIIVMASLAFYVGTLKMRHAEANQSASHPRVPDVQEHDGRGSETTT